MSDYLLFTAIVVIAVATVSHFVMAGRLLGLIRTNRKILLALRSRRPPAAPAVGDRLHHFVEETPEGEPVRTFGCMGPVPKALEPRVKGNTVREVSESEMNLIHDRWGAKVAAEERAKKARAGR